MPFRERYITPNLLSRSLVTIAAFIAANVTSAGVFASLNTKASDTCVASRLITTHAMLLEALNCAQRGDVLQLAPNRNFGSLELRNPKAIGITITSANSANPARFSDIAIYGSVDFTLRQLEVGGTPSPKAQYALVANGAQNFTVEHLRFIGDNSFSVQALQSALMLRNITGLRLRRLSISRYQNAITLLNVSHAQIIENSIQDIRTDGIRGGGVSSSRISQNAIGNFHPIAGDHPDAIQLWSRNEKKSAQDLVIEQNLIFRGAGSQMQGIFITDVNGLPFKNISIINNLLIGTMYNGIMIMGCENSTIINNTIIPLRPMQSWIRIEKSTGTYLRGNKAGQYLFNSNVDSSGNRVIGIKKNADHDIAQWIKVSAFPKGLFDAAGE